MEKMGIPNVSEKFGSGKTGAETLSEMPSFDEHMENDKPQLTDEQIKEIRKQDKQNKKDWYRRKDIISARHELEQIYKAKEAGEDVAYIEKGHVKVGGKYVEDEFGRPRRKVSAEFTDDNTIARKEQELHEMEDAYNGGKLSWATHRAKNRVKKGLGRLGIGKK